MNTINRRNFLQTFSSAFAAVASSPLASVAVGSNLYLNQALGIAIRKPSNWEFGKVRNFDEMKQSQILRDDIDPKLELEIKTMTDPLVVLGRNLGDESCFNPSAALYAEHIELFDHESIESLAAAEEELYSGILPNYSLLNVTKGFSINGFSSVRFETEFTFETETVSPINIRNISVVTNRSPFIYTLRNFDSPQNGLVAESEFDQIIKSLHYS